VLKGTPRGFLPAILRHLLKVLFQKPPIFKFERFVSFSSVGVEDHQDGRMIT